VDLDCGSGVLPAVLAVLAFASVIVRLQSISIHTVIMIIVPASCVVKT